MATSRLSLAVLALLLCAGVAQATWTCAAGFKDCDYNPTNGCEVNVHTDVNNCGNCGHKCAAFCGPNTVPSCKSAICQFACKAPFLNCDNNWKNGCEVDSSKDVNNCGSCGYKCKDVPNAVTNCAGGKCQYTCKPGFSNCDGNWMNGCEAATGGDVNNCGACGVKCGDKPNAVTKCAGSKCVYTCKPGFSNCDGNWMNGCESATGGDVNNCGACGVKCGDKPNAVTKCAGGKCVYTCKPGFNNCDGDWTNGCEAACGSDVNNCGACGVKCAAKPNAVTKCAGGKCEYTCKPGFNNCDGDWTNGCEAACGSDVNNCGACGVKCAAKPNAVTTCAGGKCVYTCKPGFANCDNNWMNGCESTTGTDVNNCGACGNKCTSPKYAYGEAKCTMGKCETQSCKKGYKWESKKSCCVSGSPGMGDDKGGKGDDHGQGKGKGKGDGKGDDKGGRKGGH